MTDLDRLTEIRRLIEAHHVAIWLLEGERDELRLKLKTAGFVPPAAEQPKVLT